MRAIFTIEGIAVRPETVIGKLAKSLADPVDWECYEQDGRVEFTGDFRLIDLLRSIARRPKNRLWSGRDMVTVIMQV